MLSFLPSCVLMIQNTHHHKDKLLSCSLLPLCSFPSFHPPLPPSNSLSHQSYLSAFLPPSLSSFPLSISLLHLLISLSFSYSFFSSPPIILCPLYPSLSMFFAPFSLIFQAVVQAHTHGCIPGLPLLFALPLVPLMTVPKFSSVT